MSAAFTTTPSSSPSVCTATCRLPRLSAVWPHPSHRHAESGRVAVRRWPHLFKGRAEGRSAPRAPSGPRPSLVLLPAPQRPGHHASRARCGIARAPPPCADPWRGHRACGTGRLASRAPGTARRCACAGRHNVGRRRLRPRRRPIRRVHAVVCASGVPPPGPEPPPPPLPDFGSRPFSDFRGRPIEVRSRGEADIRAGSQDRRLRALFGRRLGVPNLLEADKAPQPWPRPGRAGSRHPGTCGGPGHLLRGGRESRGGAVTFGCDLAAG